MSEIFSCPHCGNETAITRYSIQPEVLEQQGIIPGNPYGSCDECGGSLEQHMDSLWCPKCGITYGAWQGG